jgi:hypothetical protein
MDKIQYLQQQAARAEVVSPAVIDTLTVERLSAFAVECRDQVALLDDGQALRGQEPTTR